MTRILFLMFLLTVSCEVPKSNSVNTTDTRGDKNSAATPSPMPSERVEEDRIGSPTPALSPLPPDAAGVQSAIDVVQAYYAAINARNYRKAYEFWSGKGEASGKTFEQFRDGFAQTASTEIDTGGEPGRLEGAAGSQYIEIPGIITAKTTDGKTQKFWGEYVMRRSMVDGATVEQREWRIYSAKFREL